MSMVTWELTTEIHRISENWELRSQEADTASLSPVEWNKAKVMFPYWNVTDISSPKWRERSSQYKGAENSKDV